MTMTNTQAWQDLHTLAVQGLDEPGSRNPLVPAVDATVLEAAHAYCHTMTARHSKSFFVASSLLPREKRRAIRALYAFCRVSDDIVDHPSGDVAQNLAAWRKRVLQEHPPDHDLVAVAWAATRATYRVPDHYIGQLLDGVAADLEVDRYATFRELTAYCYGVASTVGLMSMHIIGFAGPEAIPYAVKLGVALQLTNILRDVGEDWERGRCYLPQEELARFGLGEADIARGVVTERWRAFMQFQIERTRRLYAEAVPGIALLNREGQHAIAAAAAIYGAILDEIEANDYDVFSQRAYVGKVRRLHYLCATWMKIHGPLLAGALRFARPPRFPHLKERLTKEKDAPHA